jgi:hypothetical protein
VSKIVVSSMISIDGYTEGRDGNVMAMPMDLTCAEHNADRVRAAGRKIVAGDERAFTGLPEIDLRLLDVRTWKDSGSVVPHYAVGNPR